MSSFSAETPRGKPMLLQPAISENRAAQESDSAPAPPQQARSNNGNDFLRTLFQLFEEFAIRYCVLHSWEGLPEKVPHNLDIAVHYQDKDKLALVFQVILDLGFQPLQRLNHLGNTYSFLYFWFENSVPKALAVNLICDRGRNRLKLPYGDELLSTSQRHGNLRVVDPATEFTFLLSKMAWGERVPEDGVPRLKQLSGELGTPQTKKLCSEIYPKKWASRIAEACANGSIDEILKKIGPLPVWEDLLLHPVQLVRHLVVESASSIRGWLRPTGLIIAVMRPYGVGPSALIELLGQAFGPIFARKRNFNFRPQVIPQRTKDKSHILPPRGSLVSVLFLLCFFVDYWIGYLFVVRPALTRSTLVLFNRYFQDILAEPLRFRYGGPYWVLKLISHIIPSPDLVFIVVKAEEESFMSVEEKLTPAESKKQSELYLRLTSSLLRSTKVWSGRGLDRAVGQASRLVLYQLATGGGRGGSSSSQTESSAAPRVPALISLHASKNTTHGFARHGFSRTQRYVVLPSHNAPRWLFPVGNNAGGSSKSGFQLYTPYSRIAQAMKGLVVGTIAGWQSWAGPQAVVGSKMALPLEKLVSEITGEEMPVFALSIGTPGLFRKLTVQVMRLDGEILGYIKLPLTEAASERLRHEAKTLEYLSSFSELSPYIPKLLHAGGWGDGYIVFQTGSPTQGGPTEFGPLHQKFLEVLWSVRRVSKPGHILLDEVATRWRKVEPHMDSLWQTLGEGAIAKASRELSGVNIPCGIMHGDFAPWNTRLNEGTLFVYDWEWASLEAPNSWDIHHFRVQVTSLLDKKGGSDLLLGQTPGERASFLLYILNTACQFFEEKNSDGHPGLGWRQKLLMKELS
jgi:hypothetical protein